MAGNWTPAQVPNNGSPPGTTYNVLIGSGNVLNSGVNLDINATIDNLTIDAGDSLGINNGQTLILAAGAGAGTSTNNGTISLNASNASTELNLTGLGDVTLMGTGTLTMNGSGSVIRDIDATQQRLVNAVGHTIQGRGQIGVGTMALTNQGTILANQSTSLTIDPNASGFTNEGTLRANAGSTLTVTDNLTNFSGTTLTGGTYEVFGTMRLPTGTNIVTNASTILLDGAGSQLLNGTSGTTNALANFATNAAAGDFTIQNGRNLTTPGAFSNAGIIMIDTGSMFTVDGAATNDYTQTAGMTTVNGTLTVPDRVDILGGSLFGNGTINGDVFNTVAINPGNSPGLLSIVGDYTQDPLGILNIELGGLLQGITYDFLNISLTAFLDGTLNVSLFGGFFPSVGDAFEILRSNSLSGTFTTINGLDLGGGFFLQPTYSATSLTLVAQQGSEPIPEPSTWLLLAVGLIGLVSYQYRRRLKVNRGS